MHDPAHDIVLLELADRKASLVTIRDSLSTNESLLWSVLQFSIDRLTHEIAKRIVGQ